MTAIRIGGLLIPVTEEEPKTIFLSAVSAFCARQGSEDSAGDRFELQIAGKLPDGRQEKAPEFSIGIFSFRRNEEGELCVWNSWSDKGIGICAGDWSSMKIYAAESCPEAVLKNLFMIGFCSRFCQRNGLFFHGAFVKWQGRGLLFTASSGGGKSTHAELWRKYMGAAVINGDKVLVRRFRAEARAYGSIWPGSSPYVINDEAPLSAIVVLKKGEKNAIRRLSSKELIPEVGTHIYYPSWDDVLMGQALETMDQILRQIPVYELICRPEREAAELVRRTVFP